MGWRARPTIARALVAASALIALVSGRVQAADPSAPVPVVVRWDRGSIDANEFRRFLDAARFPGYRPASESEAKRLLDHLLVERLAEQALADSAEEAGSKREKQGSPSVVGELAKRRGVGAGDVSAALLREASAQVNGEVLDGFVVSTPKDSLPPLPPPLAAIQTKDVGAER